MATIEEQSLQVIPTIIGRVKPKEAKETLIKQQKRTEEKIKRPHSFGHTVIMLHKQFSSQPHGDPLVIKLQVDKLIWREFWWIKGAVLTFYSWMHSRRWGQIRA